MDWFHRFIAPFAGLVYAIPVFYFLSTKRIPFKGFGIYFVLSILFIAKKQNYPREILTALLWLTGAVTLQIVLGILTILSYVNIVATLIHQANALVLFALGVYFIHRLRALDAEK